MSSGSNVLMGWKFKRPRTSKKTFLYNGHCYLFKQQVCITGIYIDDCFLIVVNINNLQDLVKGLFHDMWMTTWPIHGSFTAELYIWLQKKKGEVPPIRNSWIRSVEIIPDCEGAHSWVAVAEYLTISFHSLESYCSFRYLRQVQWVICNSR